MGRKIRWLVEVQLIVMKPKLTFQELGQIGQQRIESPILGEVRGNDCPNGRRSEDLLPRMSNVLHLGAIPDAVLNIFQLLLADFRVKLGRLLDDPDPEDEPNASDGS